MLRLALHDWVIAWDRRDGRAWLGGRAVDERIAGSMGGSREVVARRALGLTGTPTRVRSGGTRRARAPLRPDRAAYEAGVERIRTWIAGGQIYQANLTRRLATPFRGDAWPLYRRLRTGDPALFAAFLDLGASPITGAPRAIASASPEPFLVRLARRPTSRATRSRARGPAAATARPTGGSPASSSRRRRTAPRT